MRIIFVPQFPAELRYSEWWFTEFPKQFRARGFDVLTLGEDYVNMIKHRRSTLDMFSPINQAIELETEQIREYMLLDIQDDDILFLADLSFPGLFANVLYHKECPKMYAFCHATSLNTLDYFESVRYVKFPVESSHSYMFDAVFVGSKYHENKLREPDNRYWRNTIVTYLPFQPRASEIELFVPKKHMFMSASRPSPQKVDMKLEREIERIYNTKIYRPVSNSWEEYFANLRASKYLLITSKEDTFGYQIVDAVTNGCIPIAPNRCAYPELLPSKYLYKEYVYELMNQGWDVASLFEMTMMAFTESEGDEKPEVPRLLCEKQMRDFYDRICGEMRGDY
jgi:hypothetical protein